MDLEVHWHWPWMMCWCFDAVVEMATWYHPSINNIIGLLDTFRVIKILFCRYEMYVSQAKDFIVGVEVDMCFLWDYDLFHWTLCHVLERR